MASRTQVAVLEPTPNNALNTLQASPPPLKKRKFSHDGYMKTKGICISQFTIRAHASTLHSNEDHQLTRIALLPRSSLPLSWLDTFPGKSRRIQSGRLFVANIPALEHNLQPRNEPTVLVARLTGEPFNSGIIRHLECDELYVVERVKCGLYAVCALGDWVEEGDLLVAAKSGLVHGSVPLTNRTGGSDNWLESARIEDQLVDHEESRERKRINVSITFAPKSRKPSVGVLHAERKRAESHLDKTVDSGSIGALCQSTHKVPDIPSIEMWPNCDNVNEVDFMASAGPSPDDMISNGDKTQEEIFAGLRTHYLDALYISKTSVAYFAKGPLSRARAAFQKGHDHSVLQLSELGNHFRDCVLPMKKMDVKYRDTIPEIVRNAVLDVSDGGSVVKSRKRKSKRKKIGKNGLYIEEDEFVSKWWKNRDVVESPDDMRFAKDGELKHLIADLRIRETQMQILLILEAMALESTVNKELAARPSIPAKPCKTKKPQDLSTSLELLLDRLCIWQTVNFDEVLPNDLSEGRGKSQPPGQPADNDKLKDFCTEVIIPFYAARLPEPCNAISHKLGGPISMSPGRAGSTKQRNITDPQPGATVKRMPPSKSRRTLQRVLTDEQVGSKRKVPSLPRTRTVSGVPELKHESSDPDLLSQIKSARGGIQKPRRVDNREVDLDTIAKQHEAKRKKMNTLLIQKKDLDAAINALRKPNRELVARDFADSLDRRTMSNHPGKPKVQGVQVMATPKGGRKKDCGVSGVVSLPREWQPSPDREVTAISDIQSVPFSVSRSNDAVVKDSPVVRRNNDSSVFETPSRPSQQFSRLLAQAQDGPKGGVSAKARGGLFRVPSLPNLSRRGVQSSPTTLRKSVSDVPEDKGGGGSNMQLDLTSTVQETPPCPNNHNTVVSTSRKKKSTVPPTVTSKPSIPSTPTKAMTINIPSTASDTPTRTPTTTQHGPTSIYDQLGWDDDNDDDELAF